MNPLSSFSFGKIIKTFIPGLLAAGAPLLVGELLYRLSSSQGCPLGVGLWRCFFGGSFFWSVVLADPTRAAAFGAALVPLSLILGFSINTLLWLCVNEPCRRWCDARLDPALLAARGRLESMALAGLGRLASGSPRRVHLPDFFLPRLDLQKLTFLRESYFSWFEFHLNSAAALSLTVAAYAVVFVWLGRAWELPIGWLAHVMLPVAFAAGAVVLLVVSGVRNLTRYQEGFLWLVAGTLDAPAPSAAGAGPAQLPR
jgi:hypothetical protein